MSDSAFDNVKIVIDHRFEALCQLIYGVDISLKKNVYMDGTWDYQCLAVTKAWNFWENSRAIAIQEARDFVIGNVLDASRNAMFRAGAACSANELKKLH